MKITSVFQHPTGLYILFFTEMWERFSYYGMRAILVLFLVSESSRAENPGWGWTDSEALALYGWYTMAVYLAAVPGGWLADRWLGQKRAVILGGFLLCAGHLILALETVCTFYTGLALIIAGVGCLKPNISTLVGELYAPKDLRREAGFYLFYIGINIGALLGMVGVAVVGEFYGWQLGFGLAGLGMVLGQAVFVWGQRYLRGVGDSPGRQKDNDFVVSPLTYVEKDRMRVLLLSFLIVIVFWGAYEQAGGLMTLYASEKTDRFVGGWEIPAGAFQGAAALYIILFGLAVAYFWQRWYAAGQESSALFKMAVGVMVMGLGFLFMSAASVQFEHTGSSALWWLLLAYFFHVLGELCISPVALSFITRLAPLRYASFMMGTYFAATGLGNKLAGELGRYAGQVGEFALFTGIAVFCIAFGLLLIALLRPLNRLTHGIEQVDTESAST